MKRIAKVMVLMLALMTLVSCAQINAWVNGTELTPAARYYDALVTFNRNVAQYLEVYRLSPPDTQAKWKAQIDPIVQIASQALDSWRVALNTTSAAEKEQVWLDASKQMFAMLIVTGIIRIE